MQRTVHSEIVNSLKDIAKIGNQDLFAFDNNESIRSFGIGESSVIFLGDDNIKLFNNGILELLKYKSLDNDITFDRFEKAIVNLIRDLVHRNSSCSNNDIENIFDEFFKFEKRVFEIVVPIYGIELTCDQYKLGKFTVSKKLVLNTLRFEDNFFKRIFNDIDSDYLISIKIIAREHDKAVEVAHSYFEIFENVLNYVVGDIRQLQCPGIFNFRGGKNIQSIVITDEGIGYSGHSLDIAIPVVLNDNLCKNENTGTSIIWDLITRTNKSKIEERILRAIEWTGKAIYEKDKAKSIVEYVFAIEGLLQLNDKDFITSSIVSQISEWLAFIISDELESRKKIIKHFKYIYQKRSAVAHGGNINIAKSDVKIAYNLSRMAIHLLLTHEDYRSMKNIEDLRLYVDNSKFK